MLLDQSAILALETAKLEGIGESFANLDVTSALQKLFQSFSICPS